MGKRLGHRSYNSMVSGSSPTVVTQCWPKYMNAFRNLHKLNSLFIKACIASTDVYKNKYVKYSLPQVMYDYIKIISNSIYWPWAAIFDDFTNFWPFCGPKWRSKGLGRGKNLSKFHEKSLEMYEPLIESNKIIFNANHLPLAVIFNGKYWYLANFGLEMKAQRSREGSKFIGLYRKVLRNVRTTNKIDQNRF